MSVKTWLQHKAGPMVGHWLRVLMVGALAAPVALAIKIVGTVFYPETYRPLQAFNKKAEQLIVSWLYDRAIVWAPDGRTKSQIEIVGDPTSANGNALLTAEVTIVLSVVLLILAGVVLNLGRTLKFIGWTTLAAIVVVGVLWLVIAFDVKLGPTGVPRPQVDVPTKATPPPKPLPHPACRTVEGKPVCD